MGSNSQVRKRVENDTAKPADDGKERLTRLAAAYLEHPQERLAQRQLDITYEFGALAMDTGRSADAIAILGDAGVGKTRILRDFAFRHAMLEHDDADERPIIFVGVPEKCTTKGLLREMLRALNVPPSTFKHPEDQLLDDVIAHIKLQRVRMIMLDELHHLLETRYNLPRVLEDTTNVLKDLVQKCKVAFAFSGLPKAKMIIKWDKQIKRRTTRVVRLRPYKWTNPDEQKSFSGFLVRLEKAMELQKPANLHLPNTAMRIWAVSEGKAGNAADFGRLAATNAYVAGASTITWDILAETVDLMPDFGPERNPFRSDAVMAKLLEPKKDDEEDDIGEMLTNLRGSGAKLTMGEVWNDTGEPEES